MGFSAESDLLEDEIGGTQPQSISEEPVTSSPSPKQPQPELDLDAIFADDRFERLVQKHSNRSVAQVQKDLASMEDRLDRYETYRKTMSPEQARRELEIDDILRERKGTVSSDGGREPSLETVGKATLNISKALEDAGYDPKTATRDDIEFAMKYADQVEATNQLMLRRTSQPSPAETSPSTVIPKTGKITPPPDITALAEELDELLQTDSNIPRQEEIRRLLGEAGE